VGFITNTCGRRREPIGPVSGRHRLFTFAAYNAGPGRVAQLRKLAAQRRLNPNLWFNNVELMAAEKIGRETVTYVRNIYKYYLAYQLIEDERAQRQKTKETIKQGN
jgi:membrane-bound lytic murein transglycosylase MltF